MALLRSALTVSGLLLLFPGNLGSASQAACSIWRVPLLPPLGGLASRWPSALQSCVTACTTLTC